jgi:outer membrane cobalamin receptor
MVWPLRSRLGALFIAGPRQRSIAVGVKFAFFHCRSPQQARPRCRVSPLSRGGTAAFAPLLLVLALSGSTAATEVTGSVFDRQDGAAICGVILSIPTLGFEAQSDSSGWFSFGRVPKGMYRLRTRRSGYYAKETEFRATGEHLRLDVALSRNEYRLGEIVVTGLSEHVAPTAFVARADRAALRERIATLPEALEGMTGVRINRAGGLGDYATVAIRGSGDQQVRIYVDDIPLNDAFWGVVNVGAIPVSLFSGVEVYRGVIPMAYGGGGTGGVVRLLPAALGTKAHGAVMVGSFGAASAFGLASSQRVLAVGEYLRAENGYRYLNDNGTLYNPDDDHWTRRSNNDFRSASLLGRVSVPLGAGTLSLWDVITTSRKGVPGMGTDQARHARSDELRNLSEAKTELPLGVMHLSTSLMWSRHVTEFRDPLEEVGLGRQDNRHTTDRLASMVSCRFGSRTTTGTTLCELAWERFSPVDRLRESPLPSSDRSALALGTQWVTQHRAFTIQASVRGEHSLSSRNTDYEVGSLRPIPEKRSQQTLVDGGLGLRFDATPWLRLRTNLGKYSRAPSLYELFGDTGFVIGNTDLQLERGLNFDAGFSVTRGPVGNLEVAYYDNRLRDAIVFVQHSQFTSRPENVGRCRIRGAELTWKVGVMSLHAEGHAGWQQARNLSDLYGGVYRDKQLPGRPEWTAHNRLTVRWRRTRWFYDVDYTAGNYHDLSNAFPIEERLIHGIGFHLSLSRVGVDLEARNLTDEQVADLWGYPLPGRSYYARLSVETGL